MQGGNMLSSQCRAAGMKNVLNALCYSCRGLVLSLFEQSSFPWVRLVPFFCVNTQTLEAWRRSIVGGLTLFAECMIIGRKVIAAWSAYYFVLCLTVLRRERTLPSCCDTIFPKMWCKGFWPWWILSRSVLFCCASRERLVYWTSVP